jgi:hypothetical protein
MYAYDPDADKPWSLIRPMRRIDCHALCYSPDDDTLYAAVYSHNFDDGLALYGLSADGAVTSRKFIDGLKGRRGPDHRNWINIYPVGRFLVIYVQHHNHSGGHDMNDGSIFSNVIDRTSGRLLCTLPVLPPAVAESQLKLLNQLQREKQQTAEPRLAVEPREKQPAVDESSGPTQPRKNRVSFVVRNPATGHGYELVSGAPVPWETARRIASEQTWNEVTGHLATITSRDEAEFVARQFGEMPQLWLAGSDEREEGVWRWTDGPEQGQVFWRADKSDALKQKERAYADWMQYADEIRRNPRVQDEPNDSHKGEDHLAWHPEPPFPERDPYLRQYRKSGSWMDYEGRRALNTFLVEYSVDESDRKSLDRKKSQ